MVFSMRKLFLVWWFLTTSYLHTWSGVFSLKDVVTSTNRSGVSLMVDNMGPVFVEEPPNQVDFSNSTGTQIDCAATGRPRPTIKWIHANGAPVSDVRGLRKVFANGSLVFSPFRADDYRQDVHAAVYRCVASNVVGLIVSRDIRVRAVVMQIYEVQVYNEFVIEGNTAVFKCHIPSFVTDYVKVTLWVRGTDFNRQVHIQNDDRHLIMPSGELHILNVRSGDGEQSYRCKTRHRLTGETRTSSTSGRLIISNPQGSVSPRITDSRGSVHVHEGETAVLPCAAQGYPTLSYSWYLKANRSQLERVIPDVKRKVVGGTLVIPSVRKVDSGVYTCVVSNSLGNQTMETALSVIVPLSVHVQPREQVISLGKPATFFCTISGYPISSAIWYKDGSPLVDVTGRVQSGEILRIHSVHKSSKGMYQCIAKNDRESAQGTGELRLGDALPEFVETFSGKTIHPGNFVNLKCSVSGNPAPNLSWTLDGEPLSEHFGLNMGQYSGVHGDVVGYLNMSSVRVEDGGDYTCSAHNRLGHSTHTARINIHGPLAIRRMRNMTVVAGDNMVVKCRVVGYPVDSISWEKDGMPLPVNVKQRVYPNGTLVVQEVNRKSDGGRYTCTARVAHQPSVSREINVMVLVPPKIIPFSFQDEDLYEGMRAQITCAVRQGDLPISIKWLKNDQPIGSNDRISTRLFDSYTGSLSIDSVTQDHNGNYTCVASNAAAAVNFTAQLHVNVPPRWVLEPVDTTVVVGSDVILNCKAQGFPQPVITWMKAVGDVPQEYRELSLGNAHLHPHQNGSLEVRGARELEQGYYLCQASNGIGNGLSKVFFLDVQVPVRFEVKHVNVSNKQGETGRLACHAVGDLPVTVFWKKNSFPIDSFTSSRFEVKESPVRNGLLSILEISHVERTDTGVYTCEGQNSFGRDSAFLRFTVREIPEPPRGIAVKDYGSRFVEITWIEGNDGNSDILQYIVQFRPTSDDENSPYFNTTISGTYKTVKITDLRPYTKYAVRLITENDVGLSEASDTVIITTAEEAPGGSPQDIIVEIPESQALKISWKPPKSDLWHGDILGYNVGYRVHGSGDSYLFRTVVVGEGGSGKVILRNLRTFTHYDVVIQAYNRNGTGPLSEVATAVTAEDVPRLPPMDVHCLALSSQSIHVTWKPLFPEAVNGILLGYKILYQLHGNETAEKGSMLTSSVESVLHGLDKFQNYSIQVLGYTRVGDGVASNPVTCQTQEDVPDVPGNIKAVVTSPDTITLSWQPYTRPNGVITKYTVYVRSVENGKDNTTKHVVGSSQLEFVVTKLSRGRNYEFWVTASTSIGEGQSTRMVSRVPDYKVPATIISFGSQIYASYKSQVELPCRAAGDPFPDVVWKFGGVPIEGSSRILIKGEGDLIILYTQPSDSGEYSCTVQNLLGKDTIIHNLIVQAPPRSPLLAVASISHTSIMVHWKDNSDGGSEILGYTLFFKREYGEWESVDIDSETGSYVMDMLWCGTKYQLYIVASNKLGPGEPSEVLTVRTKGAAPAVPTKENLLQSFPKYVTLNLNSWDDGGCEILYFIIEYKEQSSQSWILVSNNIKPQRELFMLPDLQPGPLYQLRITAHNSAGSTTAKYEFHMQGTEHADANLIKDEAGQTPEVPFFLDFKLILSVFVAVLSLIVIVVVYAVCLCLRKRQIDRNLAGDYSATEKAGDSEIYKDGARNTDLRNHEYTKHGFNYLAGRNQGCPNLPSECTKGYEDDITPYATYRIPDGSKPLHTSTWHELPLKASSSLALYPDVKKDEIKEFNIHSSNEEIECCQRPHHVVTGSVHHLSLEPNVPDLLYHGTESSTSNEDTSPDTDWGTLDRGDPNFLLSMQHLNGCSAVDRSVKRNCQGRSGGATHYVLQEQPTAPTLEDMGRSGLNYGLSDRRYDSQTSRCAEDRINSRSYVGDF